MMVFFFFTPGEAKISDHSFTAEMVRIFLYLLLAGITLWRWAIFHVVPGPKTWNCHGFSTVFLKNWKKKKLTSDTSPVNRTESFFVYRKSVVAFSILTKILKQIFIIFTSVQKVPGVLTTSIFIKRVSV